MPSLATKIKGIFEDRAPNSLYSELFYIELSTNSEELIDREISNLVANSILQPII